MCFIFIFIISFPPQSVGGSILCNFIFLTVTSRWLLRNNHPGRPRLFTWGNSDVIVITAAMLEVYCVTAVARREFKLADCCVWN